MDEPKLVFSKQLNLSYYIHETQEDPFNNLPCYSKRERLALKSHGTPLTSSELLAIYKAKLVKGKNVLSLLPGSLGNALSEIFDSPQEEIRGKNQDPKPLIDTYRAKQDAIAKEYLEAIREQVSGAKVRVKD